jgi:hypothetical protein
VSLPFSDLAASFPREVVRYVVCSEVAAGRVREIDGRYAIVAECFTRETLLALQTLAPEEPELHEARERDLGAARSDEMPERNLRPSAGAEAGREAVSAS